MSETFETFEQLAELTRELNIRDGQLERAENIYESIAKNLPGSVIIVFDHDLNIFLVDGSNTSVIQRLSGSKVIDEVRIRLLGSGTRSFTDICKDALDGNTYLGEATFGATRKLVTVAPMYKEDGSPSEYGGMATFIDISELHELKEQALEDKQKYEVIFNNSKNFLCLVSRELMIVDINKSFLEYFTKSKYDVVGHHYSIMPFEASNEKFRRTVQAGLGACLTGAVYSTIVEMPQGDNTPSPLKLIFTPIFNPTGEVTHVLIDGNLIDETVTVSKRLHEMEDILETLKSIMSEGVAISANGIIIDANEPFVKLFGYHSLSEVIGVHARDLVIPEDVNSVLRKIRDNYTKEYVTTGVRKNGEEIAIRIKGKNVDENALRITVVIEDTLAL